MFTIYSIGDSAFLAQILNSLAMICGTGDFEKLIAVGLLLGFFIMGIQCIMSGTRQFNLHQIFLGFICYLCFFGPSVTVQIEDAYTGQVRTVDNVPIGAGIAGTLISNIGYGITELFEQGYGDADRMTEHSFGDALKSLNEIRAIAYDASILEAASQSLGNGTDLRKSLDNYIRECTMVKIVVGQSTPEAIYTGGIDALGYQNTIYGTQVYLPGYNGSNLDCDAAWKQLKPQFEQAVSSSQAIAALNRLAGSVDAQGQVQTTYDRVTSSLEALNVSQISARDYISTALLEPIYKKAAKGFYNDMGDQASAVMLSQALEQRNTQWAAEQSMFLSTIRPLMAFFEGFIYAITPLMGFMLVMGAFGMKMITKYFQVVAWIQLWMPVLSIVNLFILMAARSEFASIVTVPMSFYTLNNGSQILQNWIATGGMLASATPMISLFLVTGSTYAFTSLTSRMGGADHINEKTASPDIVQPAAVLSMMPQAMSSAVGGVTATGSVIPSLDLSQGFQNNISAAQANKAVQSDAAAKSMLTQASDSQMRSIAAAVSEVTGSAALARKVQSYATGDGETAGSSLAAAEQSGNQNAVRGAVDFSASGSGGASFAAIGGNISRPNPARAKFDQAAEAAEAGAAFARAGSPNASSFPQLSHGGSGNYPVGEVDQRTINGEAREIPSEFKTEPFARSGWGPTMSAGVGARASASRTSTASENRTSSERQNREMKTSYSDQERADLSDTLSHMLQGMTAEQLSKLQGHLEQAGLSSNLSSVIAAEKTYSEAQTASKAIGLRTSGKLNEIAGEIAQNKQASAELRSQFVGMSMNEKDAVNRAAEKFRQINSVDAGRAHDMAILQHMAANGRLGEVSSIYAHSQGISSPMIQAPGSNDIEKPRTFDRQEAEALQAPSFNRASFESRFAKARQNTDRGSQMVDQGHQHNLSQLQRSIDKNDADMQHRQVFEAAQRLARDPGASTGQWLSHRLDRAGDWLASEVRPEQLAQKAQNIAGLTPTQALYYVASANNKFNLLDVQDGQQKKIFEEGLVQETRVQLGLADNPANTSIARGVAKDIARLIEDAAETGLDGGAAGVLSSVAAFNRAAVGQMNSHQVEQGPNQPPEPLMTPSANKLGEDMTTQPSGAFVPVTADLEPNGSANAEKSRQSKQNISSHGQTVKTPMFRSDTGLTDSREADRMPEPNSTADSEQHQLRLNESSQPSSAGALKVSGSSRFADRQGTDRMPGPNRAVGSERPQPSRNEPLQNSSAEALKVSGNSRFADRRSTDRLLEPNRAAGLEGPQPRLNESSQTPSAEALKVNGSNRLADRQGTERMPQPNRAVGSERPQPSLKESLQTPSVEALKVNGCNRLADRRGTDRMSQPNRAVGSERPQPSLNEPLQTPSAEALKVSGSGRFADRQGTDRMPELNRAAGSDWHQPMPTELSQNPSVEASKLRGENWTSEHRGAGRMSAQKRLANSESKQQPKPKEPSQNQSVETSNVGSKDRSAERREFIQKPEKRRTDNVERVKQPKLNELTLSLPVEVSKSASDSLAAERQGTHQVPEQLHAVGSERLQEPRLNEFSPSQTIQTAMISSEGRTADHRGADRKPEQKREVNSEQVQQPKLNELSLNPSVETSTSDSTSLTPNRLGEQYAASSVQLQEPRWNEPALSPTVSGDVRRVARLDGMQPTEWNGAVGPREANSVPDVRRKQTLSGGLSSAAVPTMISKSDSGISDQNIAPAAQSAQNAGSGGGYAVKTVVVGREQNDDLSSPAAAIGTLVRTKRDSDGFSVTARRQNSGAELPMPFSDAAPNEHRKADSKEGQMPDTKNSMTENPFSDIGKDSKDFLH